MSKKYFVKVSEGNLNLVRGLLDFLVEDFILIPEICDGTHGLIFSLKVEMQKKWDEFYYNLFIENQLVTFGSILYRGDDEKDTSESKDITYSPKWFREKNMGDNER